MFEQAFFCLDSKSTDLPFPNHPVTLAACQSAKVNASKASHEAFATWIEEKKKHHDASSQEPEAVKSCRENIECCKRYLNFLETCEEFLKIKQELPIYVLIMQIAWADLKSRPKAVALFNAWFANEPDNAQQFFDTLLDNLLEAATLKSRGLEEESPQNKIDYLLIEVAGLSNIVLLRQLINKPGISFSSAAVNAAFATAAIIDDPVALRDLDALNPEPIGVISAFIHAVERENHQALDFFKEYKKHKQLKIEVTKEFYWAVDNNNFENVDLFLRFRVNAPSTQVIGNAMMRAWESKQMPMANHLKAIHSRLVPQADFLKKFGIFSPAELADAMASPRHDDESEEEPCEPATP